LPGFQVVALHSATIRRGRRGSYVGFLYGHEKARRG
jgi:hypothetical protein